MVLRCKVPFNKHKLLDRNCCKRWEFNTLQYVKGFSDLQE